MQIRFVSLNVDKEEKMKMATITVRINDAQKGTPDNLRMLELPVNLKLELEDEIFNLSKIKLINTICHHKAWKRANSLLKWLAKNAIFMQNRVKSYFILCQRKVRTEFVEFY